MIRLLTGEELPAVGIAGHTIQSQTGALKWQIDDLLVTAGSDSDARHLALSCKSNVQVSGSGLPADFVKRVWQQWRAPESPMRRETDVLALVTGGPHPAFFAAWTDICNWCSGGDAKLAIARINATKKHKRIFESIRAPGGTSAATDEETVALIRHLAVIPLDFQLKQSTSVEKAIGKCRTLLQSGDRTEAESVWTSLQQMATQTRVGSSTLPLDKVWADLRTKYDLRDQPNYAGSWNTLKALTQDYKATIETALPSGIAFDRREDRIRITASVRGQPITVVFGASGSGKSALVKTTLDGDFPTFDQVWLGPEQADAATSELVRSRLGLAHPLHDVLQSSANPQNVLVLDAAERLNADALPRIKLLIQRLLPAAVSASELPWRVVIVSQTEGWSDRLQLMIPAAVERPVEVGGIGVQDVVSALFKTRKLSWLTTRDEAVAALRNLKTLGWVIQASSKFKVNSLEPTSPAAIADRLWEFWTEGKVLCQRLLIRLAEKEAQFVRSFPLSELEPADAIIFESKPRHMPLRKNRYNRIEFEHDLAADWARFQRLKELSGEIKRWAAFANNPLWNNALRLYGHFLLREPEGAATAWDHAFSTLESWGEKLAAYILLDALCLDPQARHFLEERSGLLFANHGKLLNRLLRRFLHIGTIPTVPEELRRVDRALALYVEAKYRTPLYALWPPMATFLYEHLEQVTELVSPTVSQVCEVWLTTTPSQLLSGTPMPFRKEFAEIALATARELQVEQGGGTIRLGEGERFIYADRTELGARWWRLLELGILWSALSRLRPNLSDAPDIAQRWQRWVRWFRSRRISGARSDPSSVNPSSAWQRLKRLERARWRRAYERDQSNFVPSPDERSSPGLAVGFLDSLFEWPLADTSRPEGQDLEIGRQVLLALWSYEAAYCSEYRDEHGEYLLPYQFGYRILAKLAFYAAHVPADRAAEIWRSVLEQGPGARCLIEHFIRCWFMQLNRGCDPSAFCRVWRGMIEFALDSKWAKGGYWFDEQRVLQRLLGFDSEDSLAALPDAAQTVLGMCDLYHRWAQRNLQVDEDNVAALSRFLTSEAGAALRLDGLKWLAACFRNAGREQYWRDQGGTGEALVSLLDTTLQENMRVFRTDQECRDALVALVAQLATRQVPAALALQERIKHLK